MRPLFLFLIICNVTALFGQEILPPISVGSRSITGFEALTIGDSVFVTCYDINYQTETTLAFRFIVKPDKSIESIGLPGSINKIVKVNDRGDKLDFICMGGEKRATVFHQISFDKATKSVSQQQELFRTTRDIIGIIPTSDLLVVSGNKKQDSLIVTRIEKSGGVSEKKFFMQDQLLKITDGFIPVLGQVRKPESLALIHERSIVSPDQANATLKIYHNGNYLTIIEDRQKRYGEFEGYTTQITLDLENGTMKSAIIGESSSKKFTSYFFDGYLFRLRKDKIHKITIHKEESLLSTVELKPELTYMKFGKYYKRNGDALSVSEEYNCMEAFTGGITVPNNFKPFLQLQWADSGKIFLKVGSHVASSQSNGMSFPMTTGPTSISTPKGSVNIPASTTYQTMNFGRPVNNLAETSGTDRYFYLYGDVKNGFEYSQGKGCIDQQIDMHEIRESADAKYKLKRYLKTDNYIYAFYRTRGNDDIEVVRFNNTP